MDGMWLEGAICSCCGCELVYVSPGGIMFCAGCGAFLGYY